MNERRTSVGHGTKRLYHRQTPRVWLSSSSINLHSALQPRRRVTLLRWKRLLTTKCAYTGPQLTFTRHRRPVFHLAPIRESTIFRARFRHVCDDRIPRPRPHAHTMIDRRIVDRSSCFDTSFPGGNYRARYGDAVALSWEFYFSKKAFLRP